LAHIVGQAGLIKRDDRDTATKRSRRVGEPGGFVKSDGEWTFAAISKPMGHCGSSNECTLPSASAARCYRGDSRRAECAVDHIAQNAIRQRRHDIGAGEIA
jgi:hypothetical protein